MIDRTIYLIKTHGCSACKCMEHILNSVIENTDIDLVSLYVEEVPEWIKNNVILHDFPTTVFVKDDIIKYHFAGTDTIKEINKIIKDIEF